MAAIQSATSGNGRSGLPGRGVDEVFPDAVRDQDGVVLAAEPAALELELVHPVGTECGRPGLFDEFGVPSSCRVRIAELAGRDGARWGELSISSRSSKSSRTSAAEARRSLFGSETSLVAGSPWLTAVNRPVAARGCAASTKVLIPVCLRALCSDA